MKYENALSQCFEDWMDFQEEEDLLRDPKKAKTSEGDVAVNTICASTRTKMTLEQREA